MAITATLLDPLLCSGLISNVTHFESPVSHMSTQPSLPHRRSARHSPAARPSNHSPAGPIACGACKSASRALELAQRGRLRPGLRPIELATPRGRVRHRAAIQAGTLGPSARAATIVVNRGLTSVRSTAAIASGVTCPGDPQQAAPAPPRDVDQVGRVVLPLLLHGSPPRQPPAPRRLALHVRVLTHELPMPSGGPIRVSLRRHHPAAQSRAGARPARPTPRSPRAPPRWRARKPARPPGSPGRAERPAGARTRPGTPG